ncbi:hypothetical protein GS462_11085 [Rhodococcus hoagii]|nr:hypothetical protein [Prescottella equi]MBM4650956.1 hypothetical protein [Prescottella equi]MBM4686697.1 hypothetical protein [Prescottella equi]
MSTAEQITPVQILAKHRLDDFDGTCTCGQWDYLKVPYDPADPDLATMHAAHVVAALANAGKAIFELPEPDADGSWRIDGTDIEVRARDHRGKPAVSLLVQTLRGSTLQKSYDLSVGRDLASAVMAAGRVAEGGGQS